MADEKAPTAPTALKIKKTRHNRRKVVSETATVVITEISQKAYKGEKIAQTVRKDHKFDPSQRLYAGRPL